MGLGKIPKTLRGISPLIGLTSQGLVARRCQHQITTYSLCLVLNKQASISQNQHHYLHYLSLRQQVKNQEPELNFEVV